MARGFRERCTYARNALVYGEDSRVADNCFEMYDGAIVVTMLMRWAQHDAALASAIVTRIGRGVEGWKATAAAHARFKSEDDLAKEAARIRTEERRRFEREQSLYLSKQLTTEPTQAGLQYVMPGCEKDQTRGPAQMSLF